jgi:Raf kinase inhibitor-like YbhB/YbcL family protein
MFTIKSSVFKDGETIPLIYTSTEKGKNISPPLRWNNAPKETKSFVLLIEDFALPFFTFSHWVLFNIPANVKKISEGLPKQSIFSKGVIQAKNGYGKNEYIGPNPLWGKHHYFFKIYALNILLKPNPNLNRRKILQMIKNHILAEAKIMGHYSKIKIP